MTGRDRPALRDRGGTVNVCTATTAAGGRCRTLTRPGSTTCAKHRPPPRPPAPPGPWLADAACRGDRRFTDPARGDLPDLAEVCAACPAAEPCRDWAALHTWCDVVVAGHVYDLHGRPRPIGRTRAAS